MAAFADKIKNMLINNGMDYEVSPIDENTCRVLVINGDQMHDHIMLEHLMEKNNFYWSKEILDELYDGDFSASYTIMR